jgi:hypothetical protein
MCKTRLDTKIHPRPAQARGCKVRVQWGSHHRPSRRCRIRGRSKTQMRQTPEGAGVRGNSITHRMAPLREGRFGATRSFTLGTAGRCGMRGNPKPSSTGDSGERRRGATRDFIASTAEGCEIRGNSKIHRRHGLKMQDARETRRLILGLDGTMMVQVTCEFTIRKRQRLRSLALSFARNSAGSSYSVRSACMGSTEAARRAGIQLAARATRITSAALPAKAIGSVGRTP